ncbi:MAG: hypothetical protein K0Q94_4770 [Paenibacillus sp.]|jgi:hypothetical protein|nr:hypothetical protein [Paenibacillus sp.]
MHGLIRYDSTSAYEQSAGFPRGLRVWSDEERANELKRRIAAEKRRTELHVHYYRIDHVLAFPLPVTQLDIIRKPEGIPGMEAYPWYTWFMWAIKERWDLLHAAWRRFGDAEAGLLLQKELAITADWSNGHKGPGTAGLFNGHLAVCLANYLRHSEGWDRELLEKTRQSATRLLDRDIVPFFDNVWRPREQVVSKHLVNIPVIVLLGGAYLAETVGHGEASSMADKAREVVMVWKTARLGDEHLSEGIAYDGFWLDALTDWLTARDCSKPSDSDTEPAYASFVASCIQLALPGRIDINAPLGDNEPEMPFWMDAALKLTRIYDWPEGHWLAGRLPPARMTAAALEQLLDWPWRELQDHEQPVARCEEHPFAVSLRNGWDSDHLLAAVGASRYPLGHLHFDGGHVVIGGGDRFWITDPGYQQYRHGPEREFSIGVQAHNAPVLDGMAQTKRAALVLRADTDEEGRQHTTLQLAGCYETPPDSGDVSATDVTRDVWLLPQGTVVVKDAIQTARNGLRADYYWQAGTFLAWAFPDGWARLGDGTRAMWIGAFDGSGVREPIAPVALHRHEGSRGALTLHHSRVLGKDGGTVWWVFAFDRSAGWTPPAVSMGGSGLAIRFADGTVSNVPIK